MPRGKKKRTSLTCSSPLPGWDPLDLLLASFLLEPRTDVLGGRRLDPGAVPQPKDPQAAGTGEDALEWIRQRQQEAEPERQWAPQPEWGWCEWCPQPKHREAACTYAGPAYCCCCVYPDEEDDLLCSLRGGFPSGGVPPALPFLDAPEAGLGAGRPLVASLPGPPSDSAPPPLVFSSGDGLVSWGGECGDEGGDAGPEDLPDGPADPGGEEPTLPEPPASTAPVDSPGQRTRETGHELGVDPAPHSLDSRLAAAPGSTMEPGPVPTCAAAPLVPPSRDQGQSGGDMDHSAASTAAAPPAGPECDPGPTGSAAPSAAEESGPKFFAAATPAGPECESGPAGSAAPPAAVESSPDRVVAATPAGLETGEGEPPGKAAGAASEARPVPVITSAASSPRPDGPVKRAAVSPPRATRAARSLSERRGAWIAGAAPLCALGTCRGGRPGTFGTPPPSPRLGIPVPDTGIRLVHDPGGWKPSGGECGGARRGQRGPAP